jgi:hypothetical protein
MDKMQFLPTVSLSWLHHQMRWTVLSSVTALAASSYTTRYGMTKLHHRPHWICYDVRVLLHDVLVIGNWPQTVHACLLLPL